MTPVLEHRRRWCWDNTMSTDETDKQDSGGFECPTCGDTFERDTAMKSHHRHIHDEAIGGVTVNCENCGQEMERPPSLVNSGGMNVCSIECQHEYLGHGSRSEYTCDYCGDAFMRLDKRVRGDHQFCNPSCYNSWRSKNIRGEAHPNYNTGEAVTLNCEYCGESVRVTSDNKDHENHFCNHQCYGKWMSEHKTGQNHPSWRGGKSIYREVKAQLRPTFSKIKDRERADECYHCGESDCALHVHHIVPVMAGGTNESWNLMTLCPTCHGNVESYSRDLPGMGAMLTE